MTDNPLLSQWSTPFEMPPFDRIQSAHFRPAFARAIAEHETEIDRIAMESAPADFENTVAAMERAGESLSRVAGTFFNLTGAHTNAELQAIERDMAPVLAGHSSKIMLNAVLFARIDALYEARSTLGLDAEALRVLERLHARFVRSGAKLAGHDRTRMAEITKRLSVLGTQFSQNILADEGAYELVLEEADDLAGLPDFLIAAAASAASERGHEGRHVITLSRSLIVPFLQFSDRRDLREKAFKAWISRGESGGEIGRAHV